ncbi:sulfite exporter TauE/SafE family protein [bacterium]|nr:sulfite exporter TauE/SafE family protein [bacterium]
MMDITGYFTEQVSNGSFKLILLTLSFLGGVIASISPCSLAMLPIVIGYIGGFNNNDNKNTLVQLISFVLGSAIVFTIIGIICSITGKVFISIFGGYFIVLIASLLLAFGLSLVGLLDINLPTFISKIPTNTTNSKYLYPMLLGAIFALAGTPCSTPILAGIMSFATITNNILVSVLMLFMFALGEGAILILAGLFTNIIKQTNKVAEFSEIFLKMIGGLMIISALYLYYKSFVPYL